MTWEQAMRESEWFRTRPLAVQKAVFLWPCPAPVVVNGEVYFIVGYTETAESKETNDPFDLMLILSHIDPQEHYEAAIHSDNVIRVCARHVEVIQ